MVTGRDDTAVGGGNPPRAGAEAIRGSGSDTIAGSGACVMNRRMLPVFVVDAFTSVPFAGNPAGVVLLEAGEVAPDAWMKQVAVEMNHSETAFVTPTVDPEVFGLRWFTTEAEMDLCGHATLASAHVLLSRRPGLRGLTFETRSGALRCERPVGDVQRIEMDFPALGVEDAVPPEGLGEALGLRPVYVGRSKYDLLVVLRSEREVRECRPNLKRLRDVRTRGVMIAAADPGGMYDVVSRFFAPAVGVDEDPVTGSAHCVLGPYFGAKLGKAELRCLQASARGGIVTVRTSGDRVRLGGDAVTVLEGSIVGWKHRA